MDTEKLILQYMEKLKISREEAEQLVEDDKDDFIGAEGEEMEEKAKQIRRYEKSVEPKKPRKPREKKVDLEKVAIVQIIQKALVEAGYSAIVKNDQKEIIFDDFSVTLTKHRKK